MQFRVCLTWIRYIHGSWYDEQATMQKIWQINQALDIPTPLTTTTTGMAPPNPPCLCTACIRPYCTPSTSPRITLSASSKTCGGGGCGGGGGGGVGGGDIGVNSAVVMTLVMRCALIPAIHIPKSAHIRNAKIHMNYKNKNTTQYRSHHKRAR